jgi:hypothetical protein
MSEVWTQVEREDFKAALVLANMISQFWPELGKMEVKPTFPNAAVVRLTVDGGDLTAESLSPTTARRFLVGFNLGLQAGVRLAKAAVSKLGG